MSARARLARISEAFRSSLWAIPAVLAVIAMLLAIGTVAIERGRPDLTVLRALREGTSADGAQATLSSIATSVITVAGVTFSITIVVLQLASSQYSPRVMRTFLRDRLIQTVLGIFVATFLFSVLVLRTVHAPANGDPAFVPGLGIAIAIGLVAACMLLLLGFLHHVGHSIQAPAIVDRMAHETIETMIELYPEEVGPAANVEPPCDPPVGDGAPGLVRARDSGYLEYFDNSVLDDLEGVSLVRLEIPLGSYVRARDVVARYWPASAHAAADLLANAFSFHRERTMRQDIAFGFRVIADVAIRALSPGINDPTTAVYCVNTMGDLLCRLVRRKIPSPLRERGDMLVYEPRPDLGELLGIAFDQVMDFGRRDRDVMLAVFAGLEAITSNDGRGYHAIVLAECVDRLRHRVGQGEWYALDRERFEAAANLLVAELRRREPQVGR